MAKHFNNSLVHFLSQSFRIYSILDIFLQPQVPCRILDLGIIVQKDFWAIVQKRFPGAARRGSGVPSTDNSGRGRRTPRGRPRSGVACRRRRTSPPAARASAQLPCIARCCPTDAFPSMGSFCHFDNSILVRCKTQNYNLTGRASMSGGLFPGPCPFPSRRRHQRQRPRRGRSSRERRVPPASPLRSVLPLKLTAQYF